MKTAPDRLLIVDDFFAQREMFALRLESEGYEVYQAETGQEAIELVHQIKPGMVLLDVVMPGMGGMEVLQALRQVYDSAQLAIVMVTSMDRSEDMVQALNLGADDYVTKPLDFPVVMARIRNQLARRQMEIDLLESKQRYVLAAQGANDGLWDWDLQREVVFFSSRWQEMLGYKPGEIGDGIGEWFNRVHPADMDRLHQTLSRHFEGETAQFFCEYRMLCKDQTYRWMLTRGKVLRDGKNQPCRMAGWQSDSSERGERDWLTGLPNRALFLDRMHQVATQMAENREKGFGIFYIGLDRFHLIKERLGYELQDQLLKLFASRLERLLKPSGTLARFGADEFAVLVETLGGIGHATETAGRIFKQMERPFTVQGEEIYVKVRIGISLSMFKNKGCADLLRMAHTAMDLAKKGKTPYQIFQGQMSAGLLREIRLESQLHRALQQDEFFLLYQPQVHVVTGEILGVEALIRWRNPEFGVLAPNHFIPIAEETGLIVPIGQWVVRQACQQLKIWILQGLKPIRMAINLSVRQLENLSQMVSEMLVQTGLPPNLLELELTESLLLNDANRAMEELTALRKLGVFLSIDDFGTGYSSFAYLKKLPLNTLKIDRSFIADLGTPQNSAIVAAITNMAHSLNIKVVAEGVETKEQYLQLKEFKCDLLQGFLFSKPVDQAAIANLLEKGDRSLFKFDLKAM